MYYLGSVIHIEKTIDFLDTGNYHKKSNLKYKERASFFHFRGLIMPMCRSPPFLSKNADKKEMEEIKCQKNITFMSTDKGLKSASRYIKSTGEKKNTKSI